MDVIVVILQFVNYIIAVPFFDVNLKDGELMHHFKTIYMPTMYKTGREEISRRRLRQNWQRKEARAVYWRPEIHFSKKARQVDLLPEIIFCCQMGKAQFCFVHSTFVVKF